MVLAKANRDKEAALSLSALRSSLSYDPETGIFLRLRTSSPNPAVRVGRSAGNIQNNGYRIIRVGGQRFLAHRLAWFWVYGEWPNELDHYNRNKDDNRIGNLREASRAENTWNTSGWEASTVPGVVGVSKTGRYFAASLFRDGKTFYRKKFRSLEGAILARKSAEASYHRIGG